MLRRMIPCIALALGMLMAPHGASGAAVPGKNLLTDPGFETVRPDHSWMPAAWDTSLSAMSTVFFQRDTMLAHSGRYAISVANVSTLLPIWHNWSQTLVVGREQWGKDLVFSAWTRSNGVSGRGYILLQAYRDTVGKMAATWGVPRDTALSRLGILMMNDPFVYLGTQREYFSDHETDWVRREVRVFVPPSTNLIIVRCGLFGTGQVFFDDASLTSEPARPPAALPVGVNLLADPGFEGNGDDWEYSMPPYDEMRYERDTTEVHSGRASLRFTGGMMGMVKTRVGVGQLIANRALSGKRLRFTGWVKCDSLMSQAYLKLYATTLARDEDIGTPKQIGNTVPWTKLTMEMNVPKDSYQVWAMMLYNGPADGRVYFDDASLEIIGPVGRSRPPSKPGSRAGSASTSSR
ncbi:MAG TPA: hypothetical protein VJY35_11480 [Candidatus Eisenbacteria bacterium]|nr:hypothetical protein [Candidatus Eisenbacteria bacterium]